MPEGSTTLERRKKKKRISGRRAPIAEEVYAPRIWMWFVIILLLLQLLGLCTCQPPSRGWHYRRHLINSLSITLKPLLAKCRQLMSSLAFYLWYHLQLKIPQAFRIALKCWTWSQRRDVQENLLSWISYLWNLSQDGFSNYFLPVVILVLGISAFWNRFELKGQLARASLTLKNPINKTWLRSTISWPVTIIYLPTTVLCLSLVYCFIFADHEAFWEWADRGY